jgi:hypothetical protein
MRPGTVAHTYNPRYLGGRDKDCGSRSAWAKSSREPISTNKAGDGSCHPSYVGGIKKKKKS